MNKKEILALVSGGLSIILLICSIILGVKVYEDSFTNDTDYFVGYFEYFFVPVILVVMSFVAFFMFRKGMNGTWILVAIGALLTFFMIVVVGHIAANMADTIRDYKEANPMDGTFDPYRGVFVEDEVYNRMLAVRNTAYATVSFASATAIALTVTSIFGFIERDF